jgi:hypothetical protein
MPYKPGLSGDVYLLSVFDKSEKENISDDEIKQLLKEIGKKKTGFTPVFFIAFFASVLHG